eukprot:gene11209-15040_t
MEQKDYTLQDAIDATDRLKREVAQEEYSKVRNEREKATFTMMMKMNPEALTNIRKEFFAREDSITLEEFIYIIQKHLVKGKPGEDNSKYLMVTPEQKEFGLNMYELFKDIDVNGDGQLEWQEFTSFTVEKANLLNKRAKLTRIPHYYDCTDHLDPTALYRHRHDISRFIKIPTLAQFAIVEDHKNAIFVFNARAAKLVATINTETAPIAIENISERDKSTLVTSSADMTLSTYSLDDPNPKRRYCLQSSWTTPGVQMALAYSNDSRQLYSGGTNGSIYGWNVHERSLVTTLIGHTDIVMSLLILKKLDNIASASLDKTLGIWDSHTNEQILKLHGHKKGVFDLTYNPNFRLMVSCGFEHDACVWSPFVNSLVYRLKGHHASLVGCQSVEDSPEVITADTSGVFKLWDVRNFQCVQTFSANSFGGSNHSDMKDAVKLTCFFHSKLPSRNPQQKDDDSRIYAASKNMFAFEQTRVVHEATTDYTNIFWIGWIDHNSVIITVSEKNVIIWDALIGSRTYIHADMCGMEISACCLDDRKRKLVVGDVGGHIGIYNHSNGALMKTVHHVLDSVVVGLEYFNESKRVIAGYANGIINVYDENVLEDCHLIRSFESYKSHLETSVINFNPEFHCVASAGTSTSIIRIWDYDSGKVDAEIIGCFNEDAHICSLSQLLPYPILVTSDSLGNIVLWASKGVKWIGLRLSGFVNITPASAEYENLYARTLEEDDETPRRIVPPINRSNEVYEPIKGKVDRFRSLYYQLLKRSDSLQNIDDLPGVDIKKRRESMNILTTELNAAEAKWGKAAPAQCIGWNAETFHIYTGDDLGNIRCFYVKDVLDDIQKELLLDHDPDIKIQGLCRQKPRDERSAVLPTMDQDKAIYLLGNPNDLNVYIGVEFEWCLQAHDDRIIKCQVVPNGILSSAADRLVKMWTFDGFPLGTLLQSVPSGVRSLSWHLLLDVEGIIKKENEELDEIINQVTNLISKDDIPDIDKMDFAGMELGAKAAEFSRSELRQRVERSSHKLGIEFSTTSRPPSPTSTAAGLAGSSAISFINHEESGSNQNKSVLSSSQLDISQQYYPNKSLDDALTELKSADAAVDYEAKNKHLTHIQRKRKDGKLMSISHAFEEKSGVSVKANSAEVKGFDASAASSQNDGKQLNYDELAHVEVKIRDREKDDASINADMYSLSSTEMKPSRKKTVQLENSNSVQQLHVTFPLENYNKRNSLAHVKSKLAESIKNAQENGPRTQIFNDTCRKYKSFVALEDSIKKPFGNGLLTPEIISQLREKRELKHKELMAATATNTFRKKTDNSVGSKKQHRKGSIGNGSISSSTLFSAESGTLNPRQDDESINSNAIVASAIMNGTSLPPKPPMSRMDSVDSGISYDGEIEIDKSVEASVSEGD